MRPGEALAVVIGVVIGLLMVFVLFTVLDIV
jgi:hypothetical protein